MIKKATIKQQKPAIRPVIQLPPAVVINTTALKKPKVKADFNFDICLKELQKPFSEEVTLHEQYLISQERTVKRLISMLDNNVVAPYILNRFKQSNFKTFKTATNTFVNLIEGYFSGTVEIEGLNAYADQIPQSAGEYWYDIFNHFRCVFISGLKNSERERNFQQCITILVEAETEKELKPLDPSNMTNFLEYNIKLNKRYIIDLMELVWPDKGGTLKLLFGS